MNEVDGQALEVLRMSESEIDRALSDQLRSLLQSSFPGYPDRDYYKLPPHFRFLAMVGDNVVAQVGVELRVVRVGQSILRTFGIVDLCVKADKRSRGLAKELLTEVTEYAGACEMDFVVLFADDDRLYAQNGWRRVNNPCTWIRVDEHVTLGLARRELTNALMVKTVQGKVWPEGEVDLLGHLF
jgi:ribosomal protein S18 acetylase RimI-like enzyme